MGWFWLGNRPLPELIMAKVFDAIGVISLQ